MLLCDSRAKRRIHSFSKKPLRLSSIAVSRSSHTEHSKQAALQPIVQCDLSRLDIAKAEISIAVAREQLKQKGSVTAEGHAHRFRDTFAVELLLAGVPLERVSILLGHTSVKVTERHYSPWIRERQEQAEADVRRTWAQDPIALLETKGTPEVHGKPNAVN